MRELKEFILQLEDDKVPFKCRAENEEQAWERYWKARLIKKPKFKVWRWKEGRPREQWEFAGLESKEQLIELLDYYKERSGWEYELIR